MASDIEEASYTSPPKRIKLDNSNVLCNISSEIDEVSFSASFQVPDSTQTRKYFTITVKTC